MLNRSQRKWIYAQLYFAWVGFSHYLAKLWIFGPVRGAKRFEENYYPEGHLPVSKAFRAIAHEAGRCTTCGLCDAACPENLSPMRLLLQSPKPFGTDACLSCRKCEAACPENIPIISYIKLASETFKPTPTWRD
ncbi:MAG: 4Fe-4S dicluster domain-containing protein [Myxococcota bacterium]